METKIYKQFGIFSVILLLTLLVIFLVLFIKSGFSTYPVSIIQLFLIVIFLICLLIFYQLTIQISSDSVSFSLGVGFVGKTYKFSEIKSCKIVTNFAFNGIGIKMLSNGWLYNVSGLKAIELQFKNSNSVVRIGTNKPEEIANLINSRISQDNVESNDLAIKKRKFNPMWISVIILFAISITLLVTTNQQVNINTSQNGLVIKGAYGLTILFSDITQVDTVRYLPPISIRTNGYALGKTKIGNFRLTDGQNVQLYVKNGFPPYILIHSKASKPIYINFEDTQRTINLYNVLIKKEK